MITLTIIIIAFTSLYLYIKNRNEVALNFTWSYPIHDACHYDTHVFDNSIVCTYIIENLSKKNICIDRIGIQIKTNKDVKTIVINDEFHSILIHPTHIHLQSVKFIKIKELLIRNNAYPAKIKAVCWNAEGKMFKSSEWISIN